MSALHPWSHAHLSFLPHRGRGLCARALPSHLLQLQICSSLFPDGPDGGSHPPQPFRSAQLSPPPPETRFRILTPRRFSKKHFTDEGWGPERSVPIPTPVCRLGLHSRPAGSPAPPTLETKRFNREILCPQCPQPSFCLSLPSATMTGLSLPACLASPALAPKSWFDGRHCSWWLFVGQVGRLLFLTGRDRPPATLSAGHCPTVLSLHTPTPLTFLPDGAWGTIYRFLFSD